MNEDLTPEQLEKGIRVAKRRLKLREAGFTQEQAIGLLAMFSIAVEGEQDRR